MSKTRAIRLKDSEEQLVSQFLRENSFFDFSSLARMAILGFIKNPSVTIRPLKVKAVGSNKKKSDSNG